MVGLEETEVLAQLAEEAAARAALIEECTDVALCFNLLKIRADEKIYQKKYNRWRRRLIERNAQNRERRPETGWEKEVEA